MPDCFILCTMTVLIFFKILKTYKHTNVHHFSFYCEQRRNIGPFFQPAPRQSAATGGGGGEFDTLCTIELEKTVAIPTLSVALQVMPNIINSEIGLVYIYLSSVYF